MKKNIFKKIVASLATVAMAAGLFTAMPAEEAKAATDVKLYFKLPSGWDASDVGVNAWGGVSITGEGTVNKPSAWGTGTLTGAKDNGDGWVYAIADDSTKISGIQFVHTTNASYNKGDTDNLWNAEIANQGLSAAYFDTTTNKWYKEAACTTEIAAPVLDDVYYVLGAEGLTGVNWGNGAEGVTPSTGNMTANGSDYSVKFTNVAAGTYEYKILQDPADFGWDNAYTKESDGSKTNDNGSVTVEKKSDVTISINKDTKVVTVTVTEVAEDPTQATQATQATGETGTKGNSETITAASNSTTKAPETTTKKEETKKGVTVEVALSADAKWDKVYLHAWGTDFGTQWPGVEMTAKDGKWYATLDTELTKLSFVVSNGNGEQTVDIENVEGQNVKITLGAKNADGKFEATGKAVVAGGSTNAGDTAPIVMMLAVAAVAAGMVVASKKKTICE